MVLDANGRFPAASRMEALRAGEMPGWSGEIRSNGNRGAKSQILRWVVKVQRASGAPAPSTNTWGWGIDGGVKFNLPTLGAGDNVQLQAVWTKNAFWYSGIPDGMWGENGAVNGNGLAMSAGDTYYATANALGGAGFATPTAWSLGATFEHHFSPVFLNSALIRGRKI